MYTSDEKFALVKEYLSSGMTVNAFATTHSLSPRSLYYWIEKFEVMPLSTPNEKIMQDTSEKKTQEEMEQELQNLQKEVKRLNHQLQKAELGKKAYEVLVDLAESKYHIQIRKNSDAK